MKFEFTRKVLFFAILLVLFLFVIPRSINFNGTEYKLPSLEPAEYISQASKLGNFQKGDGLYNSQVVEIPVSGTADALGIANKRAKYANFYDLKISKLDTDAGSAIRFTFPNYYTNTKEISKMLLGAGDITFQTLDGTNLDLKDSDIIGQVKVVFDGSYGNALQIEIDANKKYIADAAIQSEQNQYFLMNVDNGTFLGVVQDPNSQNYLLAVPLSQFTDASFGYNYLTIVKTYFLDSVLDLTPNTTDQKDYEVAPLFKSVSSRYIVLGYGLIIFAMLAFAYVLLKDRKAFVSYLLAYAFGILVFISLLKLQSAVISINLLIAILLFLFIFGSLLLVILKDKVDINKSTQQVSYVAIAIVFGLIFLLRVSGIIAGYSDIFGTLITAFITILAVSFYPIRELHGFDWGRNAENYIKKFKKDAKSNKKL